MRRLKQIDFDDGSDCRRDHERLRFQAFKTGNGELIDAPVKTTNDLKIPFAFRNGSLIHIAEVDSGRHADCHCPGCGCVLIARKGLHNQQHFAHDKQVQTCSFESAIHHTAKLLVFEAINRAIRTQTPLPLIWTCDQCRGLHERNLVGKAGSVHLEQSLGECRPDVLLLNPSGRPIVALEIIVTHPPEQKVREFYQANNIALVTLKIEPEEDITCLQNPTEIQASSVSVCLRRKCHRCGGPLHQRKLYVVTDECDKCEQSMTFAFIIEGHTTPSEFSKAELDLAQRQGWTLRWAYNKVSRRKYPANVCPRCWDEPRFITYWHLADDSNGIAIGLYCDHCNQSAD